MRNLGENGSTALRSQRLEDDEIRGALGVAILKGQTTDDVLFFQRKPGDPAFELRPARIIGLIHEGAQLLVGAGVGRPIEFFEGRLKLLDRSRPRRGVVQTQQIRPDAVKR